MRKMYGVFLALFFACGVALALTGSQVPFSNITIANTSVAYRISNATLLTDSYDICAGDNNTGRIYVGDSTITTGVGDTLGATDCISKTRPVNGYQFDLYKLYVRGDTVNDTVRGTYLKYSN